MKLSLAPNLVQRLVLNSVSCPVLSFPECLQPQSSVSYPYLIKPHDFADNSQERMKHQMRGCNLGPTGHDFTDNNMKSKNVRFDLRDPDLVNAWDICNIYK
jgi:hypothetical protein